MIIISIVHLQLVDLPTIIETHKHFDNKVMYKTGGISQMIVPESPEDKAEEEKVNINEMTAAKKKELYMKYLFNHGSKLLGVLMLCDEL